MYRYLAMVWDALDPGKAELVARVVQRLRSTSANWNTVVEADGLIVFHAGERPRACQAYPLKGQVGAVLGMLFDNRHYDQSTPEKPCLNEAESLAIVETAGRHLVDRYWGRYVAFFQNISNKKTFSLRDPSGDLPCFFLTYEGIDVYFSDIEDSIGLGLRQFSINWQYIARYVPTSLLQLSETGLDGVEEVQQGECIEVHRETRKRTLLWDPLSISRSNIIEDPDQAALELRRVTRACTNALASRYDNVILALSGGLDSSIVLSCLSDAPSRSDITCLNYFTASPEGDERRYARLAAGRANCQLIERERRHSTVSYEPLLNLARTPQPAVYLHYLEVGRAEAKLARDKKASAIFDGGGGDCIFYQTEARFAPSDYVRMHGIRPRLVGVAMDAARLERRSLWSMLVSGTKDGLLKRPMNPYERIREGRTLLNPDVLDAFENEDLLPPLVKAAQGMPPGKMFHLFSCALPYHYYDPLGSEDDPERVHPLVSQPLVELCLRIPIYVLIKGGRDRSIARRAFARDVPPEIIWRRTKGGIADYARGIFRNNMAFIRELLLDGMLVRQGFLDRQAVERCLAGDDTFIGSEYVEIQEHVSTEAWLRSWTDNQQRAAA